MSNDPQAEKLLERLEPRRQIRLLLGLSLSEFRTASEITETAPMANPAFGNEPAWSRKMHVGSVPQMAVALAKKGVAEQRKVKDDDGYERTKWRLSPLGQRVLDLAADRGHWPDTPPGWVRT